MDRPEVQRALSELRTSIGGSDNDAGEDARQILAAKDDHVFVWNRRDFSLLAICLNQGKVS